MVEANDPDALIAMLKKLSMSQGLDDIQLLRLASSAAALNLKEGESPLNPDIVDDRFFVVVSGKVRTTFARGRRSPYTSIVRPGDFFGAEKILYGQTSLASAIAIEPCVLIAIAAIPLSNMLRETPVLRENLKTGFEIYRLRQNKHFAWLNEDENVALITRKHRIVLLISLVPPLGIGWLGVFFLWLGTLVHVGSIQLVTRWIGIGLMGAALLWAIWRFGIWTSEYYIITDQRVAFQEVIPKLYDSRVEIPMTMVIPPKLTQTRYEHILGFGDVFVVTDRTPFDYRVYIHIDMLNVPFPDRIQGMIDQFRQQASSKIKAEEDATIDNVLMRYLEPPGGAGNPAASPASDGGAPKKKIPVFRRMVDTFKTRLENGSTITYRKHWLELLRRVWLPTLIGLLVLGVLVFLMEQRVTGHIHFPSVLALICAGLLAYIIPVIWWVYQVLDWRNDVYQLADDKLLDIEQKPFGGQLISRPILLSRIRSLDFERTGLLGTVLNSGSIFIGTVDDELTFTGVHEPDRILREVFYRVYALRQKATEAEIRSRQDSAARMVLAYHRRTGTGRRL